MPKFQSLKGFRDFYPEDFAKRQYITDTWRRVAREHGFVEYDAPPLESLDLYRHKSGDELVGQIYSFVDKGGREVAMRPEMTPSVARMVAARWQSLPKPVKWFSIPQLFRYERPQAGRLREHFQFNADIFGDPSPLAEAELLALLVELFRAFGLGPDDIQIRMSDRQVLNSLLASIGVTEEQSAGVYGVLDKLDRTEKSVSDQRLLDLGLSGEAVKQLYALISAFRGAKDSEALQAIVGKTSSFPEVLRYLQCVVPDAREWVTFDLTIVRGLGYYTGTVFEAFDARGEHRAICGGGRYDGLLASLGASDAPAIGFGWGDVVLGDLLDASGKFPQPVPVFDFAVAPTDSPVNDALQITRDLRGIGFRAVTTPIRQSDKVIADAANKRSTAKFVYGLNGDAGRRIHSTIVDVAEGKRYTHWKPYELLTRMQRHSRATGRPPSDDEIREMVKDIAREFTSRSANPQ